MRTFDPIEKLELVKATVEALGFDFSEMTVSQALAMYQAIKGAVQNELANHMEPGWEWR
jgi:hypothetical protein